MAIRIAEARRNVPILGVTFGSLGFLTETRIDGVYTAPGARADLLQDAAPEAEMGRALRTGDGAVAPPEGGGVRLGRSSAGVGDIRVGTVHHHLRYPSFGLAEALFRRLNVG